MTRRWFCTAMLAVAIVSFAAAIVLGIRLRGGSERPPAPAGPGEGGTVDTSVDSSVDRPVPELVGPGEISLAGSVVDAGGAPVASVTVRARPEQQQEAPAVAMVATAADGSFVLRGLADGTYRLTVEGPDVLVAEVRFVDVPGKPVRIVVARRVIVEGRVADADGPAAGVTVMLASEGRLSTISTATVEQGLFRFDDLVEGSYQVWAVQEDRAASAVRVDRFGPGPFGPVSLLLSPAAVVTGQIVDEASGAGLAGEVTLADDSGVEPERQTTTDASGKFRIEGVPFGRWVPEAAVAGYVARESLAFDTGGIDRLTLELSRGGVVVGQVVTRAGVPVGAATVTLRGTDLAGRPVVASAAIAVRRLSAAGGPGTFIPRGELGVVLGPVPPIPPPGVTSVRASAPATAAGVEQEGSATTDSAVMLEGSRYVTDSDGRFRVLGLRPGRYIAHVSQPDFAPGASKPATVALGKETRIRVELSPGVVVHGEVIGSGGQSVTGATVVAEQDGVPAAIAVTGPDGRYELAPIARAVTLRVTAAGYGPVERAIKISAGRDLQRREEKFLLASADAELVGRVFDPLRFVVNGAQVVIDGGPRVARGRSTVTGDGGRFGIAGLSEGNYSVRVSADGYPPLSATVKTGTATDVSLVYGGGVRLDVRDGRSGAPVAVGTVSARGPGDARESAAVRDGLAELVPVVAGAWKLRVQAEGYVTYNTIVQVPAGNERGSITVPALVVELQRGATVAGVLRDSHGQRVHGARVRIGEVETHTDQHGEFRLENVPTGNLSITADKDGETGSSELPLRPGDELLTVDLRLD